MAAYNKAWRLAGRCAAWLPGLALMASLLLAGEALGQLPYPGMSPSQGLAPLLYLRLAGPRGMQATFFRGGQKGQSYPAPVMVGLRPGYTYRLQLSGMEDHHAQDFFPSLEVRGSLLMANKARAADFPATLLLTDDDFATVRAGGLVTRVVYLENPDTAVPAASTPDRPLELPVPPGRDPLAEAHERGRPVLVVRLGQRQLSTAELAAESVPGTILLPGEKILPPPRLPPWVPWHGIPVFDPVLGKPFPGAEYTLFDGGDVGLQAGVSAGRLVGLDPSDTVAEYADSLGRRHVAVSNRVGLCVPRFVVTRAEMAPANTVARFGPGRAQTVTVQTTVQSRLPVLTHLQNQQLEGMDSRQRLSTTIADYGTALVGKLEGLVVMAQLEGPAKVDGSLPPPQPIKKDKPLKVIKWPDKCDAVVGQIVTFFLRFSNHGDRPITQVVLSDSLTPRFEYLAGSAKTDRPAHFSTQPNDGGSLVLRWEFPDPLLAGESGLVSFQVKIR